MANVWKPVDEEDVEALFQAMLGRSVGNDEQRRQLARSGVSILDLVAELSRSDALKGRILASTDGAPAGAARKANDAQFLKSLDFRMTVERIIAATSPSFSASLALINALQPFNTTGERWSTEELAQAIGDGGTLLFVTAADRNIAYGGVGVALVRDATVAQLAIDSCVLGLGVEQAMLAGIAQTMRDTGYRHLSIAYRATGTNGVVRDLLDEMEFLPVADGILKKMAEACTMPAHIRLVPGAGARKRPAARKAKAE